MKNELAVVLGLLCSASSLYGVATEWKTNPHGKVRLIAPYTAAPQEGTIYLGFQFIPKPGWVVYWKKSGDVGFPPKFDFKGSKGFKNPKVLWPRPKFFVLPGDIKEYGYDKEVVYPVQAKVVRDENGIHIAAKVDYLTCEASCIPYRYSFALDIPQAAVPQPDPAIEPLIQHFLSQVPPEEENVLASLRPSKMGGGGEPLKLWWVIFLGFLGGVILNVMPCVLPVLSIKLFGLLQQAGQTRWLVIKNSLSSAAGIVASFLGLAGIAILARETGMSVGWGIQFQNPWFVAFLILVLVLFALNLWGVFEIGLPRVFGHFATTFGKGESVAAYFTSGIFATLLATPCSAPFLGTAMGFALAQPAPTVLAVFASAGTGMALPYLLLSAFPGSLRWLPKPGPWMQKMKVFLGVLLIATAVWLGWVFVQQVRPDSGGSVKTGVIDWVPFDEDKIQTYIAAGQPVFVDVTADWCLTCKVNERFVIQEPEVAAEFKKRGVVMMRADWTNQDAAIGHYLARHGRAGIPFYALYYPYRDPVLFSELLTKKQVLRELRAWDLPAGRQDAIQ